MKDNLISCVCLVAGIAMLLSASLMIGPIHTQRTQMGLISDINIENAPPSLTFATVAMGAFRGLVVDVLWIRADKLKDQGLFFDAKQLAEWITVLQPRFATVWDFQAWNMAYNISVEMPNTQCSERWRWVSNGCELLRDRGIPLNPKNILLYKSLAWIYQHKIGGITDDCHKYYKREIALEMKRLLDPQTNEFFQQLADAPETFDSLQMDPQTARIISELEQADQLFDGSVETFVNAYLAMRNVPNNYPEAFEVVDRFRDSEALNKLDVFAKAYYLRTKLKLDPDLMVKLNQLYGPVPFDDPNTHLPLNWEHPDVHAIYWAHLGLEKAGFDGDFSVNEKNTDRIVAHSLHNLYKRGRIVLYDIPNESPSVFLLPELRMFDVLNREWKRRIQKYQESQKRRATGFLNGHRNMLINSVEIFYRAGQIEKAGQIYLELRNTYSDREEFKVPLIQFVKQRVREELESIGIHDAREQIIFSLRDAYYQYALHEDEAAQGREQWAQDIYDIYIEEFGDEKVRRVDLPDMGLLRLQAFMMFIDDPYYPGYMRNNLIRRIQIERPELYKKLGARYEQIQKEFESRQQQQTN